MLVANTGSSAVAPPKNTANRSSAMLPSRTSLRKTKATPSRMERQAPGADSGWRGTGASGTPAAMTAAEARNSRARPA